MKIKRIVIAFIASCLGFALAANAGEQQIMAYKTHGTSWPHAVKIEQAGKKPQANIFKSKSTKPFTFDTDAGLITIYAGWSPAVTTSGSQSDGKLVLSPGVVHLQIDPKTIAPGSKIKLIVDRHNSNVTEIIIRDPEPKKKLFNFGSAKVHPVLEE